MKADVINRFVDSETGQLHMPGSEVDLEHGRIERLERAKCVRRKEVRASGQGAMTENVEKQPARRGRPKKGAR